MDLPKVGDIYGGKDPLSRYRCEVISVEPRLCEIGRKGVKLRNCHTSRVHWTSMRQLYREYRLVRVYRAAPARH